MMRDTARSYELNELQYDILHVITSPLDSKQAFMTSVLECFQKNIDSSGYLFYQYDRDPLNPDQFVPKDPVSFGLPTTVYGESWCNGYYQTSMWNPNTNQRYLNNRKSVFSVDDIMSISEYENSRNYQDLLKPAGIYYSFAVFLKQDSIPLGHVTLSRPREMGNYSKEELSRIEQISQAISNRLLDYKKLAAYEDIASLRSLFHSYVFPSDVGALLLNSDYRVLFYNSRAEEYAVEFMCSKLGRRSSEICIQHFCDQIRSYCAPRYSVFEQVDCTGRSYQFTSTPCFLPVNGGISSAYLVQFTPCRFSSLSGSSSQHNSYPLTQRQMEIVHLIAEGMSNREIATELVISEGTVKKHVENIRDILGVSSRIGILKKLNML